MPWRWMKYVVPMSLLIAPMIFGQQSATPTVSTYQWSGEFVSAEMTNSTLIVKPRIAYSEVVAQLKQFKVGDKVIVFWSGLNDYASEVRAVLRPVAGKQSHEDFMLPAELVSAEAPNQYLTIRLRVPAGSLAAIKDVKPGEWITVTSRHRPSTEAEAVVALKPYGSNIN